jgi:hypothetical protein
LREELTPERRQIVTLWGPGVHPQPCYHLPESRRSGRGALPLPAEPRHRAEARRPKRHRQLASPTRTACGRCRRQGRGCAAVPRSSDHLREAQITQCCDCAKKFGASGGAGRRMSGLKTRIRKSFEGSRLFLRRSAAPDFSPGFQPTMKTQRIGAGSHQRRLNSVVATRRGVRITARECGRQSKVWGGARQRGTPGTMCDLPHQPAKRATAIDAAGMMTEELTIKSCRPLRGLGWIGYTASLGFRAHALHPRLYSVACFAG